MNTPLHHCARVWALATGLAAGAALAADSGPVPLTRLSLGDIGGWIEVNVQMNGQPGRWLIDTGSTRHIVSAAFAERHGLTAGAAVRAHTAMGQVQGAEVALPVLKIGDFEHAGQTAVRLNDLGVLVGAAGEGLDGVLGVPLLAGVSLDLDLQRWTLAITEQPPDSAPAGCPAGTLALPLGTHQGLPVIELHINGGSPELLLLDTGHAAAVVRIVANKPDAAEPGLALDGTRLALARHVAAGAWQRANVPVARVRVPGLHRALAPRIAGLAGTALLDGTRWQIQLGQRRACVAPEPPGLPGGFGLTLVQRNGTLFIDSVLPGGPAETAGMRAGDAVQRWAGSAASGPLRTLWARVQGLDEIEVQAGPDAKVLRLQRTHFLPALP